MTCSGARLRRLLPGSALLLLALLAACGGSYGASGTTTTPAATPAGATGTGSSSSRLTATESEYKIVLSSRSLRPGTYSIVAINAGTIPHSLAITGPGVPGTQTAGTIAPGASQTLKVTLRRGRYELYCTLSGHRALGMNSTLTVQ